MPPVLITYNRSSPSLFLILKPLDRHHIVVRDRLAYGIHIPRLTDINQIAVNGILTLYDRLLIYESCITA